MNKFSQEWIQNIFRMTGKCENSRTKEILEEQGFSKNFKIINIVGTNGKGSTAQYITDALISQGYKVGKFTSPHIFKFNERIQINNKEISNDDFFDLVNPHLDTYNKENIMWFPLSYIAAMRHFQNNNIDFAVLEAGVGGVEDPTKVVPGEWGVITSISEDHMDWFKTRENITVDKAGITSPEMRFFMGTSLIDSDKKIINEVAVKNKALVFEVDNESEDYQIRNQKLANAVFKDITNKDIQEFNTPFGRSSINIINSNTAIYDVAHNIEGIKESLKYMKNNDIKFDQVVISLSRHKDDYNIENLFDCPIFIYQHNGPFPKPINEYNINGQEIKDLKQFHKTIDKNTLFIGSFFMLDDLLGGNDE